MMRKRGIGYRITAGLTVTALLTAGLSILLFYNLLTGLSMNIQRKTEYRWDGSERSLGEAYSQEGWDGVKALVEETFSWKKPGSKDGHDGPSNGNEDEPFPK